jgi:hypothetical protein
MAKSRQAIECHHGSALRIRCGRTSWCCTFTCARELMDGKKGGKPGARGGGGGGGGGSSSGGGGDGGGSGGAYPVIQDKRFAGIHNDPVRARMPIAHRGGEPCWPPHPPLCSCYGVVWWLIARTIVSTQYGRCLWMHPHSCGRPLAVLP